MKSLSSSVVRLIPAFPAPLAFPDISRSFATGILPGSEVERPEVEMVQVDLGTTSPLVSPIHDLTSPDDGAPLPLPPPPSLPVHSYFSRVENARRSLDSRNGGKSGNPRGLFTALKN